MTTTTSTTPVELLVLDDEIEQRQFTVWRDDAQGGRLGESALQLTGMYCAACAGVIEDALKALPGILDAQVSASAQRAKVTWDPVQVKVSRMVMAIRAAGYDAIPDAAASAREMRRSERRKALWRLFVASFCAMQVMMFATPSYVATAGELAPDLRQLLNWGSWLLSIPVLLFSAGPFLANAWRSLQMRRISMDVPVALGVLVTFLASTGATFDPNGWFGHDVYFDSFTMFISFLLGGRFLEMTVRHHAAESLEAATSGMPQTAQRVLADGTVETVSVHRLAPGDVARVSLGAAFPADGHLRLGATQVDEALLTGESLPVVKQAGDPVVGGSLNLGGPVEMVVERVGADTRYQAIIAMIRDALVQRPALTSKADKWAAPFLWLVIALAAAGALVWQFVDPARSVWVAVSVLIVTCPCALSLAAPSALVATARAMARRGVLVRRLDALEALASMSRLYLDKTGTLTQDQPVCQRILDVGGQVVVPAQSELVERASALAAWSVHPVSRAICQHVESGLNGKQAWLAVREVPGQGLEGQDSTGGVWRLGRATWVSGDPVVPVMDQSGVPAIVEPGLAELSVWFGPLGSPQLVFEMAECLRSDAEEALKNLRRSGVEIGILSGDASRRVEGLAQQLNIQDFLAGAQPQDKRDKIGSAQARGDVVGMVGDGVNDAPVLARADVSFAMGQGALVARAHADAVIVSGRLVDVAWSRQLAQRAMRVIRTNLAWALVYNLACIPLALMGYLPPWAAGLGMATSSLFVIGNSARLSAVR